MTYKKDEADSLLKKLGITLKADDKDKEGKPLLKVLSSSLVHFHLRTIWLITHSNDECSKYFLTPLLNRCERGFEHN